MKNIKNIIEKSILVKQFIYKDEILISKINEANINIIDSFIKGGKVLLCGNGGSAADAQHIASELSGKFYYDREPLFAEALHVNSSFLTAVSNDYSFDDVYARMISAAGKKGDVLIGISTSGNSRNVINAIKKAKEREMITIGFTGESGGELKNLCDILINVPSNDTPRIQECHIMIGHILCELIEKEMFRNG